ncbi:MAG TPA: hypothetical protein VL285_20110, partial [Bryobacteraceae bacterium]|nr:hypothetical protein [Bryobacteraceae bacterium]
EPLLELASKDEATGLGDAPWPPHFRKMKGEAPRVAPSRARPPVKKPRTKAKLEERRAGGPGTEGQERENSRGIVKRVPGIHG